MRQPGYTRHLPDIKGSYIFWVTVNHKPLPIFIQLLYNACDVIEHKSLVLMQVNCRGIFNNYLDFWNLVDTYSPHVLMHPDSKVQKYAVFTRAIII
jgi:hypothetical protein